MQVPHQTALDHIYYLGCENIDHKRIMRDFVKLKEILSNTLARRKSRVLSQASKMVLIKSNLAGSLYLLCMGLRFQQHIKRDR